MACALVGIGWAAARAQSPAPNFELMVDAPMGSTTITCVRGCTLAWVQRGINVNARRLTTFEFECDGANARPCSSGKVGGWITP